MSSMGTRQQSVADDPYSGPYKATRLWNDVVFAFRENIPNGRHRRYMRAFDNCFSGSSATEWLLQYLQSNRNFGSDVKREKALSLLNKLYNAGIFEEVKISKTMQHKVIVQENRLYRLLPASPSKSKTTRIPLAPRNDVGLGPLPRFDHKKSSEPQKHRIKDSNPHVQSQKSRTTAGTNTDENSESKEKYQTCRVVPKVLSSFEIQEVWKKTFIYRMKKVLGITRFADILSEDLVNGSFVMHNCMLLNKNGTVTNIPPADQLPQWVLSAMKCLARWPEHHEEGLPNYPGFEKDVFGVVKNYFLGLEEPLIPFELYNAVTNVFVMAGSRSPNRDDMYANNERESIVKNLWTTASLENIILDLSKKYCLMGGSTGNICDDEHLHDNDFTNEGFQSQDNVHFVYDVDHEVRDVDKTSVQHATSLAKDRQCLRKPCKQLLSRSAHSSGGLPQRRTNALPMRKFGSTPNLKVSKYETVFGPDNRTVTRVFYQNGVCTDYKHCNEEEQHNSFAPIETHFSASAENLGSCENPVNFERVGSSECVNVNEFSRQYDTAFLKNETNLQRSKSFASSSDFVEDENYFFAHRKENDDLHCLRSRKYGLHRLNKSSGAERGTSLWASQDSLSINNNRLDPVVESPNNYRQSSHNYNTDRYNHDDHSYSLPRNKHFDHKAPDPTLHDTLTKDDQACDRQTTGTSPSFFNMATPHSFKASSPTDSIGYGPGYRPVLDASKEKSISCTNLSPQSRNPPRTKSLLSIIDRNSHHMTSTPMSPVHYNRTSHLGGLQSGISLSDLTPFYGSGGKRESVSQANGFMSYPQTRLSEERVKNCLQLMTLLIAPANRRKLHMLFKLMVKMSANPNLCLDPTQTTRSLVLGTFYPAILRTEKESDFDEMLVLQLLSFTLDYYDDIFTPPNDLKTQVSERLKQMQRPQISYSPRQPTPLQYCQKISVADFENEKNIVSRQAMGDLLESIIKATNMPIKEKKKRLKQFQMTYPTIYMKRFPNPESEAQIFPAASKPKLKPPLIAKPMNRLKGLRL